MKKKTKKRTVAKVAKNGKAPAAQVKVSTGQHGPVLHLTAEQLNADEEKVYEAIAEGGEAEHTIAELAKVFRGKPDAARAKSRVRNSLRRLVRARFVSHLRARGKYTLGKVAPAKATPAASSTRPQRKPAAKRRAPVPAPAVAAGGDSETSTSNHAQA